jgi:hypothetical protein
VAALRLLSVFVLLHRYEGDSDILETEHRPDAWAAYCADSGTSGEGREPVYCQELGLAIEAPRDGASIQQLWSILGLMHGDQLSGQFKGGRHL